MSDEHTPRLALDRATRLALWQHLADSIEAYIGTVHEARVAPDVSPVEIRAALAPFTFAEALDPAAALDFVLRGLWQYQIHAAHPRYFGLFNPAPTAMGIAGEAIAAAFNSQLAAWTYNPFGVEVEEVLIRAFSGQFGYAPGAADGTFTSGGAEANHTALLTALIHSFPEYARRGLRGLGRQPTLVFQLRLTSRGTRQPAPAGSAPMPSGAYR